MQVTILSFPLGPKVEEGIHRAWQAIAVADDPEALASAAVGLSLLAEDNKPALAALDRAIASQHQFRPSIQPASIDSRAPHSPRRDDPFGAAGDPG